MTYNRKKPQDRFFKKVDKQGPNGCWSWTGAQISGGYGHFRLREKMIAAHRYSYIFHKGEIPVGLKVCHTCGNPNCVNPEHLYLDTHHGNMKKMKEEGRLAKGQAHGTAKLDDAKVKYIRNMYREGLTKTEIAKMYKVTPVTIAKVISGQRWSHVTE